MLEYLRSLNLSDRLYRNQWALLLALVVVTGYLCFTLALQPAWSSYQAMTEALQEHKKELAETRGVHRTVVTGRQSWNQLQKRFGLAFFGSFTPESRDMVLLDYFSHVQQLAKETGVLLQDINQGAETKSTTTEDKTVSIAEHTLTVHVLGDYDQVTEFVRRLALAQRIARLDSATLRGDKGSAGKLEMEIKVTLPFIGS